MFFGVEIILREFSIDALFTVMLAAMIADITAIPFLGDKPFLSGLPSGIVLHHARNYLLVAVLAVVAALMGLTFKAVLYKTEDLWDLIWKGRPEWARPAAGGIAPGLLLLAVPQRYGVGVRGSGGGGASLPARPGSRRLRRRPGTRPGCPPCRPAAPGRSGHRHRTPVGGPGGAVREGDIHPPRWGREAGLAHDRRRPVRRHDKCRAVRHGGAVLTVDGVRPDAGELEAAAEITHSLCRQQAGGSLGRLLAGRLQGPDPRMGHGDVVAPQKIAYLAADWWRRRGMLDRTIPGGAAR